MLNTCRLSSVVCRLDDGVDYVITYFLLLLTFHHATKTILWFPYNSVMLHLRNTPEETILKMKQSREKMIRKRGSLASSSPVLLFFMISLCAFWELHNLSGTTTHRLPEEASTHLVSPTPSSSSQLPTRTAVVGTFNGYDIVYTTSSSASSPLYSSVKCMGETFTRNESWLYKSCAFENLCFDLQTKEFVLFRSPQERKLQQQIQTLLQNHQKKQQPSNATTSTTTTFPYKDSSLISTLMLDQSVSIGSILQGWGWDSNNGIPSLEWFPTIIDPIIDGQGDDKIIHNNNNNNVNKIRQSPPITSWYELADPHTIMIPFQPTLGGNLGHFIWDNLLPVYSLLDLFGWINVDNDDAPTAAMQQQQTSKLDQMKHLLSPLLLMRYYEKSKSKYKYGRPPCIPKDKCRKNFEKALPLIGIADYRQFKGTQESHIQLQDQSHSSSPSPRFVCSKRGAAGIGMLSDHGFNMHGQYQNTRSFWHPHNVGRGGSTLYGFRNYMMAQMEINRSVPQPSDRRRRIVVSIHSSIAGPRDLSFEPQIQALQKSHVLSPSMMVTQTSATRNNINTSITNPNIKNLGATPTKQGGNDDVIDLFVVELAKVSLRDQIVLLKNTDILITACGGGAVTSIFLPKDAQLVLYYDSTHSKGGGRKETGPLDFAYWNQASYIQTHWLPIPGMDDPPALQVLVTMLENWFVSSSSSAEMSKE